MLEGNYYTHGKIIFCAIKKFIISCPVVSLTGIQDLLMVCKDEDAIKEKKKQLTSWIEDDPATILQKARLENTATPMSEYVSDLD